MPATSLVSTIMGVTVFRRGALVTRIADLAALAGRPRHVRFSGLPLCLDDASVRVSCSGAVAGDLSVVLEVPDADPTLPQADDSALRAAVLAEQQVQRRLDQARAWRDELATLAIAERPQPARGAPPPPSPTAARLTLIAFQQERARALAEEAARLEEELRVAGERRAAAQAAVDAATSARQARPDEVRKTVLVTLEWPAGATPGDLRLDYLVPGARWSPSYIVRFTPELDEAHVQLRAAVCQRSGEDWSRVRLTLSTAEALGWHDLPELASRRIGRRQPAPVKTGWREPPSGADELFADFARAHAHSYRKPEADEQADEEAVEGRLRESVEESVMPMAKSMAAPAPKKTAWSADRRSGFGGMAEESVSLPPAEREMRKSRRMSAPAGAPPPSAGQAMDEVAAAEPPTPPDAGPGAALLDFRHLVLPSPGDDQRGRLRPGGLEERYRLERVAWGGQALRVMRDARQEADLGSLPLPQRCQVPDAGNFAYSYAAELPVTVASDGAWHVIPLCERTSTATLTHIVVPREAREVFRVAEFANPLRMPLLAGPADIYLGERFFLAVDLRLTVVGGTVHLGLGVEQGISVARNASFSEDVTGMLRGSLALDHRVTLEVANKLPRAVSLEVRERVPVPHESEKDCTVKLGTVAPPWEDYHPDGRQPLPGAHRWRLQLAVGATQRLSLQYTVTIPAKQELVGGNRREA